MKRLFSVFVLIAVCLTVFTGCKKKNQDSAAVSDYVEGGASAQNGAENAPAQVENNETSISGKQQKQAESGNSSATAGNDKTISDQETSKQTKQSAGNEAVEGTAGETRSKTAAKTADGIAYYKENALKVVSYNIRCADDPDGNSIEERAPRLMEVLEKYDPDLIGFQEMVPAWDVPLEMNLGENYDRVIKYRAASSKEATPIYYKREKFKLLDSGYFWLSSTPDQESKDWQATCYRICSWVKLEVRQTGSVFYYFNTHFDFGDEAQVNSAKLMIAKAQAAGENVPIICTADFNMDRASKGYQTMTSYFSDVNMATAKDQTGTFEAYGKSTQLIDFCFVTAKNAKPVNYKVMTDKVGGKFVSDHYGIYNEIIIL